MTGQEDEFNLHHFQELDDKPQQNLHNKVKKPHFVPEIVLPKQTNDSLIQDFS